MKKLSELIVLLASTNLVCYIALSIYWNQWDPSRWNTPPTVSKLDLLIVIEFVFAFLLMLMILVQSDRD